MNSQRITRKSGSSHRRGFGLILIVLGLLLLAGNIGLVPESVKDVIFRWPMIIVVIGLVNIIRRELLSGVILLAIGSFFMLPHLVPGLRMADIWIYWPVLLILGGVQIFSRRNRLTTRPELREANQTDFIDEVAVFGGNVVHIESQNFQGGKITSIFGGSELSFSGSKLSKEGAVIDIVTLFGGSKIVVPREWNIKVEVLSILGGFSDKRLHGAPGQVSSPTLIIKGVAIFGGGEITSF